MDLGYIEDLIEGAIEDADASVSDPRGDGKHLAATVVSPAFSGKTLVEQHKLVYDALGEHMTTDIHALELRTLTPEEATAANE